VASAIPRGDWHDESAYARFLPGDRHCFAWEWLRRSPAYAEAWMKGNGAATAFGLLRLEDPARDALTARPFWHRGVDRAVLRAEARPSDQHDRLDLRPLAPLATVIASDDDEAGEHILLSDGLRSIRIDLLSGSLAAGPAALRWHIDGLTGAGPQLLALRQLVALARAGGFARSLHPRERCARRWIEMLRVHDAIAAGATHREIVAHLFGIDVAGPRWRLAAGSWRLRVQRLAGGARAALALRPARWLGGDDD
jgi:hypothetical protein